jgi:ABC-type transport system involved in cytochrome c biogenesis permease subunit
MLHAVFLVGDYWGWHSKELWEWISTSDEEPKKLDGE